MIWHEQSHAAPISKQPGDSLGAELFAQIVLSSMDNTE